MSCNNVRLFLRRRASVTENGRTPSSNVARSLADLSLFLVFFCIGCLTWPVCSSPAVCCPSIHIYLAFISIQRVGVLSLLCKQHCHPFFLTQRALSSLRWAAQLETVCEHEERRVAAGTASRCCHWPHPVYVNHVASLIKTLSQHHHWHSHDRRHVFYLAYLLLRDKTQISQPEPLISPHSRAGHPLPYRRCAHPPVCPAVQLKPGSSSDVLERVWRHCRRRADAALLFLSPPTLPLNTRSRRTNSPNVAAPRASVCSRLPWRPAIALADFT